MSRTISIAVLTLTLAASGPAVAQETLSAEALEGYVTGKSYAGINPDTNEEVARVVYAQDGSSVLTFPDGREEAGSWRIDGDAYCTRYANFRENSENCFRLEDLGDGRTQAYYTDGTRALILAPVE